MSKGPHYLPGNYWGRVASQALGESKEKGTPFFELEFEILGGVDPVDPTGSLIPVKVGSRKVTKYITDKTMEYFVADLARLGYAKTSLKYLDPNVEHFHNFTGHECGIYCEYEEDKNGVEWERWNLSRPREARVSEPLDTGKMRQLDALFGTSAKKAGLGTRPVKDSAARTPNEKLQEAASDAKGDDIPW